MKILITLLLVPVVLSGMMFASPKRNIEGFAIPFVYSLENAGGATFNGAVSQ